MRRALLIGLLALAIGAWAPAQRLLLLFGGGLTPSLSLNFLAGTLDPRITFTRASVATYFDVTGALQTAASGAPRFDYDPITHAALGMWIEPTAQNRLLNSGTLSTQTVTMTAVPWALSFYGTGTIVMSGTHIGTLTGTGAFPTRTSVVFTPTAGPMVLTVTGTVQDAQLEPGSNPTSYIPTTGAAVTRSAEVASIPLGPWFNRSAFSVVATVILAPNISNSFISSFNDGTGTNRVTTLVSAAGIVQFVSIAGGINKNVSSTNALTPNTVTTLATSINANLATLLLGGQFFSFSVAGNFPGPVLTALTIGGGPTTGSGSLDGHLQRMNIYPAALTQGQMLQATNTP